MAARVGAARRAWVGITQAPKHTFLLAPGFQNSFTGGTNTTVISTANSGVASGDAFSTVTGSPTFSSTHPLHGPLTAQFSLITSTVTSLTTTKPGTTTEHWVELYVYFTANPAAITTLYTALSTATAAATIKLDTAGKILVAPTSGTTDYTFTNAITLNAWNRIEFHLINSTGTGTEQTRLYAADSTTVVEDSGVRSTTSTLANTTSHVFGQQAAVAGTTSTWWLADVEVGTTGFPGPNIGITAPAQPARTAPSGPTLRGTFTPTAVAPLTTASFTPTAGALLITTTYGDATAGVGNFAVITDSLGGRWDPMFLRNFTADGRNGYLQAWYQVVEASPAARTVTVTDQDGAQVHGGWVEEWTSVDTTGVPFGVTEYRASNTADPLTIALTTAYPNSQVIGAGMNWDTSAWVAGAATTVNQTSQVSTFAGGASLKATVVTPTAGTTVTLTASRTGVVADFHLVAFELLGAKVVPAVPPTVRSTGQFVGVGSVTSGVVPLPAGWQPGDVCYLFASGRATTGTITGPAGYAVLAASFHASSSTSSQMALYRRVLQAGDTDPTVTCTSGRLAVLSVAVQNADTATVEDVTVVTDVNGVQATTITAPTLTPTNSGDLLLCGFGYGDPTTANVAQTVTPPAGFTEVGDICTAEAAATDAGVEVASLALTGTSATGVQTATCTASVNGMGVSVAVRSGAGGGTTNGTATLTGAGTLTAGVTQGTSASLTGAGTVTAAGGVVFNGTATLTGAGTVTAAGSSFANGTASLTGAGTLTAQATQGTGAALAGAGSLTAQATQNAAASPTGAGALTAQATQRTGAALSGAGTLTAAGSLIVLGTASLVGAGTLTASTSGTQAGTAALTGAGTLTAGATQGTSATLTGAGVLSVQATQNGSAAIAGAGTLSAQVTQRATATLTGAGTLTASSGGFSAGTAALTGAGTLSAAATVITPGAASLTGAGTVSAQVTQRTGAALIGAGALTATGRVVIFGTASPVGAGTLTATGVVPLPFTVGVLTSSSASAATLSTVAAAAGLTATSTLTASLVGASAAATLTASSATGGPS